MIHKDEKLLAEFRTAGPCELCYRWCNPREPHHLWGRGVGGGTRLDIRINLIALGSSRGFQCECHTRIGDGNLDNAMAKAKVANREGVSVDDIERRIMLIRRAPKRLLLCPRCGGTPNGCCPSGLLNPDGTHWSE